MTTTSKSDGGYQNASLSAAPTATSADLRGQNTSTSTSQQQMRSSSSRSSLKMKQNASLENDFAGLDIKSKVAPSAPAAKKNNNAEDDLWNMLNN